MKAAAFSDYTSEASSSRLIALNVESLMGHKTTQVQSISNVETNLRTRQNVPHFPFVRITESQASAEEGERWTVQVTHSLEADAEHSLSVNRYL